MTHQPPTLDPADPDGPHTSDTAPTVRPVSAGIVTLHTARRP